MFRLLYVFLSLTISTGVIGEERSIIGGEKVEQAKYKFMVSLVYRDQGLWAGHFAGDL